MNKKINKKDDDDELGGHLCYGGVIVGQDDSKTGEKTGCVELGHDAGFD